MPASLWGSAMILLFVGLFLTGGCSKRGSGIDSASVEITEAVSREEAVQLIAEFESDQDEARRIEIVFQFAANGSEPARSKIVQLYHEPPSPRLKLELVHALSLMEEGDLDFALLLLRDAAGPGQPVELRQAAIETLGDIDEPRTLPVWRALANDPDADIRKTAAQAIEYNEARFGPK